MNICRIVKHDNLALKGSEQFVLKFDGDTVYINSGNGLNSGPVQNLHQEIVAIADQSDYFLLEDLEVDYKEGFLDKLNNIFSRYSQPSLGMIYFDVLPTYIGERYSPDFLMKNKPPVGLLSKSLCPGLPMVLDQQILMEMIGKAAILYIPTDEVTVSENLNSPS